MKTIEYHIGARFDVLEIVEHYELVDGVPLADRFVAELEKYVETIAERPRSYVNMSSGVRRANMRRFPYHIIFRVLDDNAIRILAVKHEHRHPSYGSERR